MKHLLSATAALALLVAAGQAGAQTTGNTQGATPAVENSGSATPGATNSSSMNDSTINGTMAKPDSNANGSNTGAESTASDKGATASATEHHHSHYARSEWAENRREAKITNELNQQQLAKADKDSSSMSGTSSSNMNQGKKMNSSWQAGHHSTKAMPSDTAGSGSSSGAVSSPSAGSDAAKLPQSDATPHAMGDKPAAPDSSAPESSQGSNANNGR